MGVAAFFGLPSIGANSSTCSQSQLFACFGSRGILLCRLMGTLSRLAPPFCLRSLSARALLIQIRRCDDQLAGGLLRAHSGGIQAWSRRPWTRPTGGSHLVRSIGLGVASLFRLLLSASCIAGLCSALFNLAIHMCLQPSTGRNYGCRCHRASWTVAVTQGPSHYNGGPTGVLAPICLHQVSDIVPPPTRWAGGLAAGVTTALKAKAAPLSTSSSSRLIDSPEFTFSLLTRPKYKAAPASSSPRNVQSEVRRQEPVNISFTFTPLNAPTTLCDGTIDANAGDTEHMALPVEPVPASPPESTSSIDTEASLCSLQLQMEVINDFWRERANTTATSPDESMQVLAAEAQVEPPTLPASVGDWVLASPLRRLRLRPTLKLWLLLRKVWMPAG